MIKQGQSYDAETDYNRLRIKAKNGATSVPDVLPAEIQAIEFHPHFSNVLIVGGEKFYKAYQLYAMEQNVVVKEIRSEKALGTVQSIRVEDSHQPTFSVHFDFVPGQLLGQDVIITLPTH